MRAYWSLLRPLDWIKNVILFAPLFFSPERVSLSTFYAVALGFLFFCLASSATYVLNDIKDCHSDQLHPQKASRPIANGAVSLFFAKVIFVMLLLSSLVMAFCFYIPLFWIVLSYCGLGIFYCFWLKHIPIVDVFVITFGFILRVIAGAVLIQVSPSQWLLICTGLVALFLALAKRRDDLIQGLPVSHRKSALALALPCELLSVPSLIFVVMLWLMYALGGLYLICVSN